MKFKAIDLETLEVLSCSSSFLQVWSDLRTEEGPMSVEPKTAKDLGDALAQAEAFLSIE